MLVVRVMQMSIDDIVDMVAVRNCLMSTLSAVGMARVVSGARMGRRAASRIRLARGENVLVDMSLVEMMQVPVVKIILVAIVFDGLVPAVGPVLMIVSVVYRVIRFHRSLSLSPGPLPAPSRAPVSSPFQGRTSSPATSTRLWTH